MKKRGKGKNLKKDFGRKKSILPYILSAGFLVVLILTAVIVHLIRNNSDSENNGVKNTLLATGEAVWASDWCAWRHRCPAGEGDCDRNTDCLTGYCAQNAGLKYNKSRSMDVCECASGKVWDEVNSRCILESELTKGYIIEFKEPSVIEKSESLSPSLSLTAKSSELSNQRTRIRSQRNSFLNRLSTDGITGGAISSTSEVLEMYENVVSGVAIEMTGEEAKKIASYPEVKAVYNDTEFILLEDGYSTSLINADYAWKLDKYGQDCATSGEDCLTGKGVTIGIIDTGVDYTHPDLGGCIGSNCKVIGGDDFGEGDRDPMDNYGHGTHCAAIAAGKARMTPKTYSYREGNYVKQGGYIISGNDDGSYRKVYKVHNIFDYNDGIYDLGLIDVSTGQFVIYSDQNPSFTIMLEGQPYYVDRGLRNTIVSLTWGPNSSPGNPGAVTSDITAALSVPAGLNGVAPDAKLYIYKVSGKTGRIRGLKVLSAIDRSVDPNKDGSFSDHLDVISISLGSKFNPFDIVDHAVNRAVYAGVVVVVSAGNDGPNSHTIGSPGTAPKVITVGATDLYDRVAYFSSRGYIIPGMGVGSSFGIDTSKFKPEIVAPGVDICAAQWNTWENDLLCNNDQEHISISGTSMAAPHVAGAAALILQKYPGLSPAKVKDLLMRSAKDLGEPVIAQGAGRLDIFKAVNVLTPCADSGLKCSSDSQCCSGICYPPASKIGVGASIANKCGNCRLKGGSCANGEKCCSGNTCKNSVCR